jgi:hypothetical protein
MTPEDRHRPEWLAPRLAQIPDALKQRKRWFLWAKAGDGRKVPRSVEKPDSKIAGNKSENWRTFEETVGKLPSRPNLGLGFALGAEDKGATLAGIDCDGCRNPATGAIQPWAQTLVRDIDSYTEVSPSGTGVKIFLLGRLPEKARQGKVYQLEIYDHDRFFTVTGHHLPGTPTTLEDREPQLRALYARQRSANLLDLVKLFGLYQRDRGQWVDITCPWAKDHSEPDNVRDAALHLNEKGEVDGFECFHASHSEKRLPDVLKLFGVTDRSDFITVNNRILATSQENIHRALAKLDVAASFDTFAQRLLLTHATTTRFLDDPVAVRVWLTIDSEFGFRPAKEFFQDVLQDTARRQPVHPVRAYLDGLTWDGCPRLDLWLTTYGKAEDTPLTRAIASIVLIAAVRRVRKPGCKFDELLVLQSEQGWDKSSALRTLCPNEEWFSDDLPLGVDAKQVIERTQGKWIIEASELVGIGKREAESLKSFLSRQTDGPVRLAYERFPTFQPRQFVLIGTTNAHRFLKDKTGNRRFWPVRVGKFEVAQLRRDRDQLWAEAAYREAKGEVVRLNPSLYKAAAAEQEARMVDDEWIEPLRSFLGLDEDPDRPDHLTSPVRDRIPLREIWECLGVPLERRDERAGERLNGIMQMLGYEKKNARGLEDTDRGVAKRWVRVQGQLGLDV